MASGRRASSRRRAVSEAWWCARRGAVGAFSRARARLRRAITSLAARERAAIGRSEGPGRARILFFFFFFFFSFFFVFFFVFFFFFFFASSRMTSGRSTSRVRRPSERARRCRESSDGTLQLVPSDASLAQNARPHTQASCAQTATTHTRSPRPPGGPRSPTRPRALEATLIATPGMRSVIAKYAEQNLTYLKVCTNKSVRAIRAIDHLAMAMATASNCVRLWSP